ncbi:MAG: DUF1934 domain-containing protein [Oscillospiraceae bacterium]|nr:DUF1934 domain-containing protein [Oscillospiraceae bacterium]
MPAHVTVTVTTDNGTEALRFSGGGTLKRDDRGVHLLYTYTENGVEIPSEVHLGMGRALVRSPACRLLLDPERQTETQIAADGGTLPLTVETHRVHADLSGGAGTIILHYTLLAQGRPLQTLRVTLTLAPIDKERTR